MKKRIAALFLLIFAISSCFTGCNVLNEAAIKVNLRNDKFDYIKESKVDKIIIQNVRDSGFKFIVNDTSAIDDIYNILKKVIFSRLII